MKKLLVLNILILVVLLGACRDNNTDQQQSGRESNDNNIEQNSYGGFEHVGKAENLGTYKSGPISVTIKAANLNTGTLTDDFYIDLLGKEKVDYMNIAIDISTESEKIQFDPGHLKVVTDAGETIESPHDYLSDKVEMQYLKSYNTQRILVYVFEDTKAENVESVDFIVEAPTNEIGESLGKDIEVPINFSKGGE